eukprot:1346185-Rhodomonas_salina.1
MYTLPCSANAVSLCSDSLILVTRIIAGQGGLVWAHPPPIRRHIAMVSGSLAIEGNSDALLEF